MKEIKNGRKKEEITSYSDTSPAMVPKSDEHQYCSKNVATPGLPTLLYQPGVRTNLEVTVLYTQVKVMVLPFVTCSTVEIPLGVFKLDFYGFIISLVSL